MQEPDPPARASRSRRFRVRFIVVAVVLILYFAITGGVRSYVSSQVHKSEGRLMPAFELTDLNGRIWTAADFLGKKTVLNFFRSRCPSCWRERDVIRQLNREADQAKVQVVSVMTDRVAGYPADLTKRTLQRFAYEQPVLMADKRFLDAFHGAGWAHVTPITYVVDAKGRIIRALRGEQTLETLRSATR